MYYNRWNKKNRLSRDLVNSRIKFYIDGANYHKMEILPFSVKFQIELKPYETIRNFVIETIYGIVGDYSVYSKPDRHFQQVDIDLTDCVISGFSLNDLWI